MCRGSLASGITLLTGYLCGRLALEHEETINDCVVQLAFFKGVFSIPKFSQREEEKPLPLSEKVGQQLF